MDRQLTENYIEPKTHLYKNLPKFNKSRFHSRLVDAILSNGFEGIGIHGHKGLGKSTLSRTIAKQIYGSHEVARMFRITRLDELPPLIELVQKDPRFWIDYNGLFPLERGGNKRSYS
jgi:ABC-type multidrug transport system ATPase subunit